VSPCQTQAPDHINAVEFLSLHRQGRPLLLGTAWDAGRAGAFASLGFLALA